MNVMGTVRLLEAARRASSLRAILVVTTDKVYRNSETGRHFLEASLGGHDPYSASKAACELAVASSREAFLHKVGVSVATARGGNVLGGGDFSEDRLVPDVVRSALYGTPLNLRNPLATRPWQHVLDCLCGYLRYTEALYGRRTRVGCLNFGPAPGEHQLKVFDVTATIQQAMGLEVDWCEAGSAGQPKEMQVLGLDPSLAASSLGWRCRFSQKEAIEWTALWYRDWLRGANAQELTLSQIQSFMKGA